MLPKSKIEAQLNDEIVRLLATLEGQTDTAKYQATVDQIAKLHKLKTEEGLKLPSLDNVLIVSANLLGILWLTTIERERPIVSKAINFVLKPR